MQTVKAVIGSSALAILMAASTATAESQTHKLKGDFAFSGGAVCVVSSATFTPLYHPPLGFNPNLTPIGPTTVTTFSIQGVRTFNGDGTGSMKARGVFLGNPPGPVNVNVQDITAQFTYSVAADGTVTIDQGPTDSLNVGGTGQLSRVTDIPTFVGRLSSDRNSLTFATFNPGVETVTRLVPAPEQVTLVRVCHRERTGIRISRQPGSNGHGED